MDIYLGNEKNRLGKEQNSSMMIRVTRSSDGLGLGPVRNSLPQVVSWQSEVMAYLQSYLLEQKYVISLYPFGSC